MGYKYHVQFYDGVWANFKICGSLKGALKCLSKQIGLENHLSKWRIVSEKDWSQRFFVLYSFSKERSRNEIEGLFS